MAWIRTIPPGQGSGRLSQEYERRIQRAAKVHQILEIQSLKPATLTASMWLYVNTVPRRSGLTSFEREMLALVVSRVNECLY